MGQDAISRVAIGMRDRIVQVYRLDSAGLLHPIFSVQLDKSVPVALSFCDNAARDVMVFGLFDGKVVTLRGDNGQVSTTVNIESSM